MPALSRWECSANIDRFVSQPSGLSEPFESGQSGNAMPALMLVVKAPSATSTNTQAAAKAENAASAGLYEASCWLSGRGSMSGGNEQKKATSCPPQTL